jgi:hypothetical protein
LSKEQAGFTTVKTTFNQAGPSKESTEILTGLVLPNSYSNAVVAGTVAMPLILFLALFYNDFLSSRLFLMFFFCLLFFSQLSLCLFSDLVDSYLCMLLRVSKNFPCGFPNVYQIALFVFISFFALF